MIQEDASGFILASWKKEHQKYSRVGWIGVESYLKNCPAYLASEKTLDFGKITNRYISCIIDGWCLVFSLHIEPVWQKGRKFAQVTQDIRINQSVGFQFTNKFIESRAFLV